MFSKSLSKIIASFKSSQQKTHDKNSENKYTQKSNNELNDMNEKAFASKNIFVNKIINVKTQSMKFYDYELFVKNNKQSFITLEQRNQSQHNFSVNINEHRLNTFKTFKKIQFRRKVFGKKADINLNEKKIFSKRSNSNNQSNKKNTK